MTDIKNFEDFLEQLLEKEDFREEPEPAAESEAVAEPKEKTPEITPRNPFKFLDAYTPADLDIFFGRDMEIAELYQAVFSRRVSVVFGNSGAGKTSLVQCGFFGRIKPEKAAFFSIRSAIDPMASLKNDCIRKISPYHENSDLFGNLSHAAHFLKKTLILFFDQFEEIFILQPVEARKELAILLKKIIHSDLDIKIIIGIREEYFARLIEFERVVPDILANRIWVRNMSGMQAETVIVNPCRVCGVGLEPDVSKQVIAELSQGKAGVELPYIQVVMDNLYHQAAARDSQHPNIRSEDVAIQGGVRNILSNFIENQIQDMPDAEKAKQVLKSLITSEGTKRILDISGISDAASNYGEVVELPVLQEILRELVKRRILREDPDSSLYELRHDSLAQTVRQWMTGIEQELMEVRQTLESRFREYQARGTLLDASLLKYIAPYESRLRLKTELRDFIDKSKKEAARKRRKILIGAGAALGVFFLIVSSLGIFSYFKSLEAVAQKQIAEQKTREAEVQLTEANHNLGLVFLAKAEMALKENRMNEVHLYSLYALKNLKPDADDKQAIAKGNRLTHSDYSIIFSSNPHSDDVNCVSFSPNGKTLASGSSDKTISLWDVASGRNTITLIGHSAPITSVVFSPDGKTLASGSQDETIRLWDVVSGKNTATLTGHSSFVESVVFSPDGKTLASGSGDETIRLWDIASGRHFATLTGHSSFVWSVSFSPDGKTLASESVDGTIRLWDVVSRKNTATLTGYFPWVNSMRFSPDGSTLASGGLDDMIRLCDIASGKNIAILTEHSGTVFSVSFSPDGKTLASGSWDNTIRLSDTASGKNIATLAGHSSIVLSVSFSPDGKTLASGSRDKTIRLWDLAKEIATLTGHSESVFSVSFSPDGKTLAGSRNKTIRLWDTASGKNTATLIGHSEVVTSVSFSPDLKTLASGSDDKTIRLWDVASGKYTTLTGHSGGVYSVSFSPDGKTLASGSLDSTIRLWDTASGKKIAILTGHSDTVLSVSFSSDGKTLASGSGDKTIRLWDTASGKNTGTLTGHYDRVTSVSFSPDGKTLASGSSDSTIRLWDTASGKNISTLTGYSGIVESVSFSPDGKTLASGSSDHTIRLWDVAMGKHFATLTGYSSGVYSVSFSPDGKTLASGSVDKTIRLWDISYLYTAIPIDEQIRQAEEKYGLVLKDLELVPPEQHKEISPPRWSKSHPFHWLSRAESGDAEAMAQLGVCYDRDNDNDKALYWYRKAADAGNAYGKERLAFLTKYQDSQD